MNRTVNIAIGSDHKGFPLKEHLKKLLADLGHEPVDFGPHSEASVDYPDYAAAVARSVAGGTCECGIVICASGVGVSIAANKVPGIRAALCHDLYLARMSRLHNNANVLALGALVVGTGLAEEIVRVWLATSYEGGRHQQRLDKIAALETVAQSQEPI
jgi:ribose 5-phosphate isomerase B